MRVRVRARVRVMVMVMVDRVRSGEAGQLNCELVSEDRSSGIG